MRFTYTHCHRIRSLPRPSLIRCGSATCFARRLSVPARYPLSTKFGNTAPIFFVPLPRHVYRVLFTSKQHLITFPPSEHVHSHTVDFIHAALQRYPSLSPHGHCTDSITSELKHGQASLFYLQHFISSIPRISILFLSHYHLSSPFVAIPKTPLISR